MGLEGGEQGVSLQKHTSIETPPWTRHHILGRTRGADGACAARVGGRSPNSPPAPKPTPTPKPEPTTQAPAAPACHPSYVGACLDPDASDYDCVGGSGNGPKYTGRVTVLGPDVFDLDRDSDGIGCERD